MQIEMALKGNTLNRYLEDSKDSSPGLSVTAADGYCCIHSTSQDFIKASQMWFFAYTSPPIKYPAVSPGC